VDDATAMELLHREQQETFRRVAEMTVEIDDIIASAVDSNGDDEHDPEGATIAFERARLSALLDGSRAHQRELIDALVRLECGAYGICTTCGEAIASARLEVRPWAQCCSNCASAHLMDDG
jgi:RNA polymerase-binding transcription factor DksA